MHSEYTHRFNLQNTFIVPSLFGWSTLVIASCLFVLGTNFQNNIILIVCYLLLSILLLSLLHGFFFFTQHLVEFLPIQPDYENRHMFLPIRLYADKPNTGGIFQISLIAHKASNESQKRLSFRLLHANKSIANNFTLHEPPIASNAQNSPIVKVPLPSQKRGKHACPTVNIASYYGFGLFKTWSIVKPDISYLVYPSMEKSPLMLANSINERSEPITLNQKLSTSENLQGVREYQKSDPMHYISWKHVAKGQGLLSKDFEKSETKQYYLRLKDYEHLPLEQALRRICYSIQQLNKDENLFGLELGSQILTPNKGIKHMNECLEMLALYPKMQRVK